MSNQSNQNKVRNSILNSHFFNLYIPNFASIGRFDLALDNFYLYLNIDNT